MQDTRQPVWRIYVENRSGVAPDYAITEAKVQSALGLLTVEVSVTVRSDKEPDLELLRQADFFIGSGFDPSRIAAHGKNLKIVHCASAGIERYLPINWLP